MPTPADRVTVAPDTVIGTDPDHPAAVSGAVHPADRTGVGATGPALEPVDEVEGGRRGTPPTAGVGWRSATRASADATRAVGAAAQGAPDGGTQVGDVVQVDELGAAGTSSSSHHGAQRVTDGVDHQPVLLGVLGRLQEHGGQGAAGPVVRSVVPASGRLGTWVPWRSTSSSGLAPTNRPSGVGTEKSVQLGSSDAQRRSRSATSGARSVGTSTLRARTTLSTSPRPMAATASDTPASKSSSPSRGRIRQRDGPGSPAGRRRPRPPGGPAGRAGSTRPRRPSGPATTVTHSVPSGSAAVQDGRYDQRAGRGRARRAGRRGPARHACGVVPGARRSSHGTAARRSATRSTAPASSRPPGSSSRNAVPRPTSTRPPSASRIPSSPRPGPRGRWRHRQAGRPGTPGGRSGGPDGRPAGRPRVSAAGAGVMGARSGWP